MSNSKKAVQDFLRSNPLVEYLDAFIVDFCGRAIGKRYPASQIETAHVLKDYLGKDFLETYAQVKLGELDEFLSEISPREYNWYL